MSHTKQVRSLKTSSEEDGILEVCDPSYPINIVILQVGIGASLNAKCKLRNLFNYYLKTQNSVDKQRKNALSEVYASLLIIGVPSHRKVVVGT